MAILRTQLTETAEWDYCPRKQRDGGGGGGMRVNNFNKTKENTLPATSRENYGSLPASTFLSPFPWLFGPSLRTFPENRGARDGAGKRRKSERGKNLYRGRIFRRSGDLAQAAGKPPKKIHGREIDVVKN